MTDWLMDDEAEYLELLELYEEAREDVDRRYPRRKDAQTKMIYKFGLGRWLDAHLFMECASREVRGEWWERDEHK